MSSTTGLNSRIPMLIRNGEDYCSHPAATRLQWPVEIVIASG
ncbi:MAG TPA: hypothetical protein VF123_18900 [Candidatus Sulfotelmatobacter sp.]